MLELPNGRVRACYWFTEGYSNSQCMQFQRVFVYITVNYGLYCVHGYASLFVA